MVANAKSRALLITQLNLPEAAIQFSVDYSDNHQHDYALATKPILHEKVKKSPCHRLQ